MNYSQPGGSLRLVQGNTSSPQPEIRIIRYTARMGNLPAQCCSKRQDNTRDSSVTKTSKSSPEIKNRSLPSNFSIVRTAIGRDHAGILKLVGKRYREEMLAILNDCRSTSFVML
ncbi:hypothetical protein AAMO2058_001357300 [Amorphochlora amoebiformis]